MNIITHTSKTIILCPGRVKRNTPVIIMRDLDSLGVQCRLVTGGTPFICDKSDLRYYEEAGV